MYFLAVLRQGCRVVGFVITALFRVDRMGTLEVLLPGAGAGVNITFSDMKGYTYWILKWIPRFFF